MSAGLLISSCTVVMGTRARADARRRSHAKTPTSPPNAIAVLMRSRKCKLPADIWMKGEARTAASRGIPSVAVGISSK